MKQRGRKSTEQQNVVDISVAARPRAPTELTKTEKALFNQIVADRPAEYFDAATIPLLVEYCRIPTELSVIADAMSTFQAKWLNKDDGVKRLKDLTGMRDKSQKRMALLATKMRLAQQSRYNNREKSMRPTGGGGGAKPWES